MLAAPPLGVHCSGLYPRSDYDFSVNTFPEDGKTDPLAYVAALDALPRGSAVVIFTPDDTHFEQGAEGGREGS